MERCAERANLVVLIKRRFLYIAEHVCEWLTNQTEQERNKYEAEWLGKGDVLLTRAEVKIMAKTIVAKTGFVVPDRDVRAWRTALSQLPKALDNEYEHGHHTP